MKPPQRTIDLRQANTQVILRHLYFNGPESRLDLSAQTRLSPSTVTNVVGEMYQSGLLVETGLEESYGGRPRTILDINPGFGYLIGVDLGETHVQMELFDLTRHKLGTLRENIHPEENTLLAYVRIISHNYLRLINEAGIPRQKLLGMGIGVPGIVGHNGRVSVAAPMWLWEPVPLLDLIEKEINLPVYIDNGAKAMALAEAWFGAGRGLQDMVVILIGTGIGAGIITKGSLYRGATNSAGEWGHTKVSLDGRLCRCGSQGCLEAYVGAPGILTSLHEASQLPPPAEEENQLLAISSLVSDYAAHEPIASKVMRSTAQILGAGIANLVNLFNPELIVIGGWAGLLIGEAILDEIKGFVKEYSLPTSTDHLHIQLAELGQDAICTGAACLVLEEFLSSNHKFSPRPPEALLPYPSRTDVNA